METVTALIGSVSDVVFDVAGDALSFAAEQPLVAIGIGIAIVTGLIFTGLAMVKH